jgi:hypothetical protein
MADDSKRDETSAEIAKMLNAGFRLPIDLPRCHCGALATVVAYTWRRNFYFCREHEEEARPLV